jgi:hypothetical protein
LFPWQRTGQNTVTAMVMITRTVEGGDNRPTDSESAKQS